MRLILLIITISFSGYSQQINPVILSPVTNVPLDSSSSYIYCATMDIMWNELSQYLGENPKTSGENATVELLNQSISGNYRPSIEDEYTVARSGLIKDSIVQKINSELDSKFGTHWSPGSLPEEGLMAYSFLKKDVKFVSLLDDEFSNMPFNDGIQVDYFGVNLGDPNRTRKSILINDYKDKNDFILQLKCLDSLDEIYLAKIPLDATLSETYQSVMNRLALQNVEKFDGSDILMIPYIQFDTTVRHSALEGLELNNAAFDNLRFQSVSQRISFDLNPQGIKLESSVVTIIEFPDYENRPKPRLLAFDKPFLIIMKRTGSDQPYFMYWVSGVEFMRSYIVKPREITEAEMILVGKWKMMESISEKGEHYDLSQRGSMLFHSNGTFERLRRGQQNQKGSWHYENKVISLVWAGSNEGNESEWILDEISENKFIIGGKTKLVFEKE